MELSDAECYGCFKVWCWMQLANVKAIVDERHLQSALPLLHSGRVKVPLMLHVSQVMILQHTHACLGRRYTRYLLPV